MKKKKMLLFFIFLCIGFYLIKWAPIGQFFTIDHIYAMRAFVAGYGYLSVVVYTLLTILCCICNIPIIPIALLSAVLYGPIMGTIVASFATTVGSGVSFLLSRFFIGTFIRQKIAHSTMLQEIYNKTEKYGFLMLIITRLVPIFPFGIQNYVYGITKIPFSTYLFYSWISMIPATCIVTLSYDIIVSDNETNNYIPLLIIMIIISFILMKISKKWYKTI